MSKTTPSASDSFEQQLEQLEQIVARMEKGELSLEKSIVEFERGMKIANQCQKTLQAAELKVKVLMSDENGEQLQDFAPDADLDPNT